MKKIMKLNSIKSKFNGFSFISFILLVENNEKLVKNKFKYNEKITKRTV